MQPQIQQSPNTRDTFGGSTALTQNRVLRNTYWLLAITLVPTAIGALIGANMNMSFMRTSPFISFFVIMAVFYGWIFAIEKNRDSALGVGLLLGFTLFLGLLLGPLLQSVMGLRNGGQLVATAFGGTALTFFGLSAVASSTKRDFSGLGKFLTIGCVVIMLAVVANLFLKLPALTLTLLAAFILFSAMIILWQINSIVRGGETNYVSATLTLYIAVYNIFSSLLQLLGIVGGDRD